MMQGNGGQGQGTYFYDSAGSMGPGGMGAGGMPPGGMGPGNQYNQMQMGGQMGGGQMPPLPTGAMPFQPSQPGVRVAARRRVQSHARNALSCSHARALVGVQLLSIVPGRAGISPTRTLADMCTPRTDV